MAKRGGWIVAEALSWVAAASVILCGVGVFVALGNDPKDWERELRRYLRGGPQVLTVQVEASEADDGNEGSEEEDAEPSSEALAKPTHRDLAPRP